MSTLPTQRMRELDKHLQQWEEEALHSNSRLRVKARKQGVGAPEFLRFAKL